MIFSEDTSRDFETFLEVTGLTQQNMRDGLERTVVTSHCLPSLYFCVDKSDIQGYGIFTTGKYTGTVGLFHTQYGYTVLGRYTNHSYTPNSIVVRDNHTYDIYLLTSVSDRTELTVDYEQVMETVLWKDTK